MHNVRMEFRGPGMGGTPYALSWEEGGFRYHIWYSGTGQHGEHIYKNAIDPERAKRERTGRLFATNKTNQVAIAQALAILNKPIPAAFAEAEKAYEARSANREAEIAKGEVKRARTAFSEALKPYPWLREAVLNLTDAELLEVARTINKYI